MSAYDDGSHRVSEWIHEYAAHRVPDHLDRVLAETSGRRQRPAWSSLERWLPMDLTTRATAVAPPRLGRLVLVGLIIVVLAALGIFAVGSRRQQLPPPFGLARNGAIVYAQGGDILSVDPATGQVRPIISGPEQDSMPVFSRDGTLLAFVRVEHAGLPSIVVARADGSDPRRLASLVQPTEMAWSPDGTRLAVVSSDAGRPAITIVPTDEGPARPLDLGVAVDSVQWRPPDGKELIFRGKASGADDVAIYGVSPDGVNLHALTPLVPDSTAYGDPRISSDGVTLTYWNWESLVGVKGQTDGWMHVRNLTTNADRQVRYSDKAAELKAVFSPDGENVLIERQSIGPNGTFPAQAILAPVEGGKPAIPIGPEFPFDTPHRFGFTPDGQEAIITIDGTTHFFRISDGIEIGPPLTMEFPDIQRLHP